MCVKGNKENLKTRLQREDLHQINKHIVDLKKEDQPPLFNLLLKLHSVCVCNNLLVPPQQLELTVCSILYRKRSSMRTASGTEESCSVCLCVREKGERAGDGLLL